MTGVVSLRRGAVSVEETRSLSVDDWAFSATYIASLSAIQGDSRLIDR